MATSAVSVSRTWAPRSRLQPWILYDLERVAWIVEARAAELTAEERALVRDAVARMGHAVG